VYAIYLPKEIENNLPPEVNIPGIIPVPGSSVQMLGSATSLRWTKTETGFTIFIPASLRNNLPCREAWTFRISNALFDIF
jgi:alpha-L-fucosidase